ncbi:MAG: alkaline phosphatase D family protein [Rubripirellula sp.]|nr:alkaline phosphatase D family protein [Rubripirellula sp.]
MNHNIEMRLNFSTCLILFVLYLFCLLPPNGQLALAQQSTEQGQTDRDVVGPVVGAIDQTSCHLLYRPGNREMQLMLELVRGPQVVARVEAMAKAKNDFVAKFYVDGLQAGTEYRYRIKTSEGKSLVEADAQHFFTTRPQGRENKPVSVGFVSCVDIEPNGIWSDMNALNLDAVCLMGDTPYIDTAQLSVVRSRHRQLLQVADLATLATHTPTYGTWDDHDFGRNNGNGRNMRSGKVATRQGFIEYRAHDQFGNGREGVYHKVDLGLIEVFLLDPRYFSQTEPSPVDPSQTTCFGKEQWNWLLEGIRSSKAPFKVLAAGSIWEDKKNSETDDMFTYWYERDALLDIVKREGISGVVLLGGDIHVARHLVHRRRVGYDLHDFVISPGHTRVISGLDVYHPSLEWSLVEGWQFLTLSAEVSAGEPVLTAEYRQPDAVVNRKVVIPLRDISPTKVLPATGPSGKKSPDEFSVAGTSDQELRAYWSFDNDFRNQSVLGTRIDAIPHHDAAVVPAVGVRGGALRLRSAEEQFVSVPRSFLDETSSSHTVSLWFNPNSLPPHGSSSRAFLLESTAQGKPSNTDRWHLSIGFRATGDPDKINLQLYTHTVSPAAKPEAAPTAISQGPFSMLVDRVQLLDKWNHLVWSFDGKRIQLNLGSERIGDFELPVPGPASEFGGLILGGHREGTGRNFDGMIDEVKIWQGITVQPQFEVGPKE